MALLSSFVGTEDMIRDRIAAFRSAGITTIRAEPDGETADQRLRTLARFIELVRDVNESAPGDLPGTGDTPDTVNEREPPCVMQ
jgi:hypothetical protein